MKRLVVLLRAFGWTMLFAWPIAWFWAWWVWPPAPRPGWQIPENERALGFLSDSQHLLTEEYVRENDKSRPTGVMRVWNIDTGQMHNRYACDSAAGWRHLAHHRFVFQHTTIPGQAVTYFVSWPHDLKQLQVFDPWTGEVIFRDEPVHEIHLSYCISHGIIAYVREGKVMALPELVWRDLSNGKVFKTFPGLAGPIDFSPNGSRFLATRWKPDDRLAELVQLQVPSGEILRSIQIPTEPNSRFSGRQSCNDDHLFVWPKGVLDWKTGQAVYSTDGFLSTLSRDGRFLVERKECSNEHSLEWTALGAMQPDRKRRVIFALGESQGGMLGWFAYQESNWIAAASTTMPHWPLADKVPWLKQWLPKKERQHFVVVDENTGQIIVQGKDRRPMHHSPNRRLLIMSEGERERHLLWSIPFDSGFPLPLAAAVAILPPGLFFLLLVRRRSLNEAK